MGSCVSWQAEWVNKGGEQVIEEAKPKFIKVVHGNRMTAAATCANVVRHFNAHGGLDKKVFLTGPTSKVGGAVALYLVNQGFEVVCCTRSQKRFDMLQEKVTAEIASGGSGKGGGRLVRAEDLCQGNEIQTWVVGKYDLHVNTSMPWKGDAIVFATPNPIDERKRPDLNVIDGEWLPVSRLATDCSIIGITSQQPQ